MDYEIMMNGNVKIGTYAPDFEAETTMGKIELKNLRKPNIEKEQITITVSSMRLDNMVAELAKCSRSKANEMILQERIFLNFEPITKATKEVKIKDKITIRGKGRFEIKEMIGRTRKGNILLQIET